MKLWHQQMMMNDCFQSHEGKKRKNDRSGASSSM
jgi:hypothetical protein